MTERQDILRAAPFGLTESAIAWVSSAKASLNGSRRLAQLFNVMLDPGNAAQRETLRSLQPGVIIQFTLSGLERSIQAAHDVKAACDVPVLVCGDIEGGAICLDGATPMPNQLAMAALPDDGLYRQALTVMLDRLRAACIGS